MRFLLARRIPLGSFQRRLLPLLSFSTDADSPPAAASAQHPQHKKTEESKYEMSEQIRKNTVSEDPEIETVRQKKNARTIKGDYEEEESRVLRAALDHVLKLGWSDSALLAGARDVGLSPSMIGSFPRKEAALVEFFMDDCLEKLVDRIESGDLNLKDIILSERLSKLLHLRLELQAQYISKWAQALSIQGQPQNMPASFKQRAMLIDEIWHAAGDRTAEIDWYIKRAVLGGIYSASEIFMLTDNSPGFRDTWQFLDHRIKDAFDVQKAVQEAAHLAEAVSAGVGNSVQALIAGVSQGFKF